MRRVLKGLLALVFAVLPLVLLIAGAGLVWMSRSLPPAAGTVTVEGLSGPVTIARDGEGVPHVTAASRDDVMEALLHVAIYAGIPRANHAIKIVKEILAEMDRETGE